jgi:flagellar basal body-associated protein FliL
MARVDLKWLLMALAMAVIVFSSVVMGVKFSVDHFTNQTHTVTQFVKEMPPKPGPILPIVTDQVVNLAGGRFLRFTAAIQFVEDPAVFAEAGGEGKKVSPIANYEALIKDAIVTVTSRHSADDLLNLTGKEKLKDELRTAINAQIKTISDGREEAEIKLHPAPKVYKIYFTSFVIS